MERKDLLDFVDLDLIFLRSQGHFYMSNFDQNVFFMISLELNIVF